MKRLYILSGSSTSTDAENLLLGSGLKYEVVDVSDRDSLAAIYRDLEIGVLPALWDDAQVIEGLAGIRNFVEGQRPSAD